LFSWSSLSTLVWRFPSTGGSFSQDLFFSPLSHDRSTLPGVAGSTPAFLSFFPLIFPYSQGTFPSVFSYPFAEVVSVSFGIFFLFRVPISVFRRVSFTPPFLRPVDDLVSATLGIWLFPAIGPIGSEDLASSYQRLLVIRIRSFFPPFR